ncbi:uncharacterized protein DEA37_0004844 [Paragonimus westermani]|uniref:Uncharacterized protein n=1 Tax=Paragonimus westermani TaxID=34504 RepID=A0A5J4N5V3_9TREM|nr:uncharacterized protein DEA37_0004844 [Paragonimus westermani]
MIRDRVRGWLRLPKDTTLALFHTKIDGHGLGIPCLETIIPLEQRAKFERLVNSVTPVIASTVQSKPIMSDIAASNVLIFVYGMPVSSKLDEVAAWNKALVRTHDGSDLKNAEVDKASYYWMRNPEYVFSRLFTRGLQLWEGLLRTRVRNGRGNRGALGDLRCREAAWKEALVRTHDGSDLKNTEVDKASFYWMRNPDGTPVIDKASAEEAQRQHLHATLDGAPLRDSKTLATSQHWLRDGSRMFPWLYIRTVQLRAGVLSTKSRRARGRPTLAEDLRCRGNCGTPIVRSDA